jgi:fibrillarin-like pre-rRNA processing protein
MSIKIHPHEIFDGVYVVDLKEGKQLATLNLARGKSVYGETLLTFRGREFRLFNPYRSKLAAAILKGAKILPIRPGAKVLYLGVASGTTASHVSDIVNVEGFVFGVDFAYRVMRDFVNNVCVHRPNVSPILGDARLPESYRMIVDIVDCIYCDIAQPRQASVLADNADMYLTERGWIMLAIKARSIDVTKKPSKLYKKEASTLRDRGFLVKQVIPLEPYDVDHCMVIAQRR